MLKPTFRRRPQPNQLKLQIETQNHIQARRCEEKGKLICKLPRQQQQKTNVEMKSLGMWKLIFDNATSATITITARCTTQTAAGSAHLPRNHFRWQSRFRLCVKICWKGRVCCSSITTGVSSGVFQIKINKSTYFGVWMWCSEFCAGRFCCICQVVVNVSWTWKSFEFSLSSTLTHTLPFSSCPLEISGYEKCFSFTLHLLHNCRCIVPYRCTRVCICVSFFLQIHRIIFEAMSAKMT